MKNNLLLSSLFLILFFTTGSCLKKTYNPPPDLTQEDPQLPVNTTIARLKNFYASIAVAQPIDSEWTISGIITGDDRSGNIYKQITLEDSTGGISLSVDGTGLYSKLPVGRKIYVRLKGLYYGFYNGLPQIGYSTDESGGVTRIPQNLLDRYVVRADYPHPVPVTVFDDLAALSVLNKTMLNRLVRINNVEIALPDLGKTYAENAQIASGSDIGITDCNGKTIILRNSAFASFQSLPLPQGKGSITALYMIYRDEPQLVIRDTSDMQLYGSRCNGGSSGTTLLLNEDFSDLDEWTVHSSIGDQKWNLAQFGNPKPCAYMSGYASGNKANEDWLISKELNLSGFQHISLQFESAGNYEGKTIECYLSTNYSGSGAPGSATWTLLPANYDTEDGFSFTPSGNIDLSAYKDRKVHIAFKYTSTTAAAASWEVDNVRVSAE